MRRIYYYPSPRLGKKYLNPYSICYRESLNKYLEVVAESFSIGPLIPIQLIWAALVKADIYLFNWIENFGYKHFKIAQFYLLIICFKIIKWRGKKIVWMFHNIHPHAKTDVYSDGVMSRLFEYADLIVAHSKEAAQYAQKKSKGKVLYRCHPVRPICDIALSNKMYEYDILIWGTILPYKGIPEFLSYVNSSENSLKILIAGSCNDKELDTRIREQCSERIIYQNRRFDFTELKQLTDKSRYILFPYIGTSVSSSGALIDTIAMGGNAIGPNKGAFKDIAEEGCCFVYNDYAELMNILNRKPELDRTKLIDFIHRNSWDNFVKSVINEM